MLAGNHEVLFYPIAFVLLRVCPREPIHKIIRDVRYHIHTRLFQVVFAILVYEGKRTKMGKNRNGKMMNLCLERQKRGVIDILFVLLIDSSHNCCCL